VRVVPDDRRGPAFARVARAESDDSPGSDVLRESAGPADNWTFGAISHESLSCHRHVSTFRDTEVIYMLSLLIT
jgi:hypothetical protein